MNAQQMGARAGLEPRTVPSFDHEKLDVYRLELEFVTWVTDLLVDVKANRRIDTREVRDQLDRASISVVLNTAEGNGKRQRAVRAKYFDDARGSTTESAACLDVLVAKRAASPDRVCEGKAMLARIGQMLTRLVALYSDVVREDAAEYVAG